MGRQKAGEEEQEQNKTEVATRMTKQNDRYESEFIHIKDAFAQAHTLKQLRSIKKQAIERIDAGESGWNDGAVDYFWQQRKEELTPDIAANRTTGERRIDRMLNCMYSDGHRARRWQ